jgi:Gpi18-like mannosyltransferase
MAAFLKRYSFPLTVVIALRVVLSIWLAVIWFLFLQEVSQSDAARWETYHQIPPHTSPLSQAFAGVWMRWDAVHYMNIAYFGYPNLADGEMNFWPLYPYLIRLLLPFTGGDVTFTGLLFSTICTLVATIFLYELIRSKFQNEQMARLSVLAWNLYPTSFFLYAPYTESLFAFTAVGAFLMLDRKRWLTAGIFILLAGLTRSQGILLIIPLVLEVARHYLYHRSLPSYHAVVAVLISPAGFLSYMFWRNQQSSMNIFNSYETYSLVQIVDPFRAVIMAVTRLITAPDLLQITELFSILFFLSVMIWMLLKCEFRNEWPFILYGIAVIIFAMLKHNLAASPMQSSNRYVLSALPAFIGVSWLLQRIPRAYLMGIGMICAAALLITSCLYALWFFIG